MVSPGIKCETSEVRGDELPLHHPWFSWYNILTDPRFLANKPTSWFINGQQTKTWYDYHESSTLIYDGRTRPTTLSCLVQSSWSILEQYIGLCPIVIIHGRIVRFSGAVASYPIKKEDQDFNRSFAFYHSCIGRLWMIICQWPFLMAGKIVLHEKEFNSFFLPILETENNF